MRVFAAYIIGSLLREAGEAAGLPRLPRLRADKFPHLTALSEELKPDPDDDFEFGLDLLLHAISSLQTSTTRMAS
jgi:hypothetical protein